MILRYLTYLRCQCVEWGMPCWQWIEINCELHYIVCSNLNCIKKKTNVICKTYLFLENIWEEIFLQLCESCSILILLFYFSISRDVSKKTYSVKAEESPLFLRRTSISFLNHHNHLQEWSHSSLQVMFSSAFKLPFNRRMSAWKKVQLYPLKAF